jgi:hypothetical protein
VFTYPSSSEACTNSDTDLAENADTCSLLLADEDFSTHFDSRCASDKFRASLIDQRKRATHSSLYAASDISAVDGRSTLVPSASTAATNCAGNERIDAYFGAFQANSSSASMSAASVQLPTSSLRSTHDGWPNLFAVHVQLTEPPAHAENGAGRWATCTKKQARAARTAQRHFGVV